jgi:hypothetical protein
MVPDRPAWCLDRFKPVQPVHQAASLSEKSPADAGLFETGATGLEPATSGLTVRRGVGKTPC